MDNKAKVPTGITAAKKQTLLPTHAEYQVILSDNNFIVDSKHKFIPLFISDMDVVKSKDFANDAVSYSGPTYISRRSAKHSGCLTFYHLCDINKVDCNYRYFSGWKFQRDEGDDCYNWWRPWWKPEVYKHYQLCKWLFWWAQSWCVFCSHNCTWTKYFQPSGKENV